jgi:hypothetical protein
LRANKTLNVSGVITYFRTKSLINENKNLSKDILSLFSQVASSANRYIVKNNFTIPVIKQNNSPVFINHALYNSMAEGEMFLYIDINHCYWRIAYLQGIISEKFYKRVLKNKNLKIYRNMALACLIATKSKSYYIKGEHKLTVTEVKQQHNQIYQNIRFTAYNLLGEVRNKIGDDNLIGYRTDAILCKKEVAKKVGYIIFKNNFTFKVLECAKIDDHHYQYGDSEIKKI